MKKILSLIAVATCMVWLSVRANNGNVATKEDPKNDPENKSAFAANPLLLNGKSLNYETFWLYSQGTLAVVSGNPESEEAVKIPFYVYLNREGFPVREGASNSRQIVYSVDVAKILASARPGDELIIEPARKTDSQARRIIRLRPIIWPFPQNWLPKPAKGQGC
ncbi:hypothetical protein IC229_31640 [Spirosoma sp. BT702]|uniref:Uncharacterized protein n=1 Tax=Spirosoma profusum TaxID=2771354 RepID=A0A927GA30_9BACT|nr:hypothetical protein [Spirosoma profusum]MBD2705217.1 hypothetical protein [Spirosoma profusum]